MLSMEARWTVRGRRAEPRVIVDSARLVSNLVWFEDEKLGLTVG